MTESFAAVLRQRHLPALDGLRAVAVFVVMIGHFTSRGPGDLGVSAFFVLSGFLITWLMLSELKATGTVSLRGFYLRRTLRIVPAYYAFLAFTIGLDLLRNDSRIRPLIVPSFLYLVNYYNAFNGHPSTSVSHAWSLAIEEQFYLFWPLGFLLLIGYGRRTLAVGLTAAIGAVLAWRCIAYFGLDFGSSYVYNAFDTRFDNLAIGCLLAVVADTKRFVAFADSVSRASWMPLVTIAILLVSRVLGPKDYHYGVGFTVNAILLTVLIVQFMTLHASPLWRWLGHPIAVFLGTISYPLYLYHQWGLGIGHRLTAVPPYVQLAVGVAVSLGLASASYYVVERPFLSIKRRLETRVPVAAPVSGWAPTSPQGSA